MYAEAAAETRAPPFAGAAAALRAQRGRLVLWVPVCLGLGIGTWFALGAEPGPWSYAALVAAALALALLAHRAGEALAPVPWALALVAAGVVLAGARAHMVAEPVLGFRYYGPVEGRIVAIDRSASDKVRLTLDRVRLHDVAPDRTPARVRVSLHGRQGFVTPEPGLTVILTGHLSPPGGPVEPGGFDFRRNAWFDRLGAVGYTRTPVLAIAPAEAGRAGLAIHRVRMALSRAVQDSMGGGAGAFAAAILTGDRAALPAEDVEALRASNLAHLLAISGLHMGLLSGVVFGGLRLALALIPFVALRLPTKKIAAVAALGAAAGYLALSGGSVATLRAFVMVAVMLVAVLLDRRAISLRSVAIAATIVLLLRPEELLGPGFQMSFAATTALVAVYGWLRDRPALRARLPRALKAVGGVVLTSAVAGAATAPYGAAHFNQISEYGLLANLLSVPLMGAVVMPAAVAAAVLWPVGLAGVALEAMRLGILWILAVAHRVADLPGALAHVPAPGPAVLPLLSLGALVWLLWQGRARHLGALPVAAALALWVSVERPALLVSETGGLIGLMTPEGRALSKPRGDGFAARVWLENDGDPIDQAGAAGRPGLPGSRADRRFRVADLAIRHVTGRDLSARLGATCGPGLVILNQVPDTRPDGPCRVIDPAVLRRTGALAVVVREGTARTVTARDRTGARLWNPP